MELFACSFHIYQNEDRSWCIETYDNKNNMVGEVNCINLTSALGAIKDVVEEKNNLDMDFEEN